MSSSRNSQNKISADRIGIDIGSSFLRASITNSTGLMIDNFEEVSLGVSCGVIVEPNLFEESLTKLVRKIKRQYKKFPPQLVVGVGGVGIRSGSVNVSTYVSRADGHVNFLDIEKLYALAKEKSEASKNKTILHTLLIKSWIDGVEVVGHPEGLKGSKLEAKVLIISDDTKQIETVNEVFDNIGLDIDALVASPLADAHISLSKREKKIGSASLNIGGDTTSICVYENSVPLLTSVIKSGGEMITSDIALGLRVPIDIAEAIKKGNNDTEYSKRRYEEIVEARVSDLAKKINDELGRIMRAELLPGGVILLGGTSKLAKLDYYLRYDLKLPIGNAMRNLELSQKYNTNDINFGRSYGLTFFADSTTESRLYFSLIKRGWYHTVNFIKKFLP